MLSSRQCKLARLLTQDTTLDSQIIKEYISISADDKRRLAWLKLGQKSELELQLKREFEFTNAIVDV